VFEFTNLFDKWLDNLDPEDFFCLLMNVQKIIRPETFEEVRHQPGMFLYRVFAAVDQRLQCVTKQLIKISAQNLFDAINSLYSVREAPNLFEDTHTD